MAVILAQSALLLVGMDAVRSRTEKRISNRGGIALHALVDGHKLVLERLSIVPCREVFPAR